LFTQFLDNWKNLEKLRLQKEKADADAEKEKPAATAAAPKEKKEESATATEQPAAEQKEATPATEGQSNGTTPAEDTGEKPAAEEIEVDLVNAPMKPSFMVCCTKEGHRTKQLSLDGLLDYLETDTQEKTFEISLFAEVFFEMLESYYAGIIFDALKNYKPAETTKRPAESSLEGDTAKRQKTEENGATAVAASEVPAEAGKNEAEAAGKPAETTPATEEKKEVTAPEGGEKKRRKISDRLLLAFRFFDRNESGFIKMRDLAEILEFVNQETSSKQIAELTEKLCTDANKILYEDLNI